MNIKSYVVNCLMMMKWEMHVRAISVSEVDLVGSVDDNTLEIGKFLEGSIGDSACVVSWCIEGWVEYQKLAWVLPGGDNDGTNTFKAALSASSKRDTDSSTNELCKILCIIANNHICATVQPK